MKEKIKIKKETEDEDCEEDCVNCEETICCKPWVAQEQQEAYEENAKDVGD
jgi:hypothetical protein